MLAWVRQSQILITHRTGLREENSNIQRNKSRKERPQGTLKLTVITGTSVKFSAYYMRMPSLWESILQTFHLLLKTHSGYF